MPADLDRGHLAALATTALGVWLMAAPALLDYGAPMSTSDRIAGPALASVGGIAVWEVARGVRWAALPISIWLLLAPWILGAPLDGALSSVVTGLAAFGLALLEGDVADAFGGGWRAIWQSEPPYRDLDREDGAPR